MRKASREVPLSPRAVKKAFNAKPEWLAKLDSAVPGKGNMQEFGGGDAFLNRAATGARAPSVADNLDIKARALIVMSRKKGGESAVISDLMQLVAAARYEGQKASDERRAEEVKAIHRVRREATIADFMASYTILLRLGQSDDPKLIGALTLAAIVDSLAEAGYTAKGRR